MPNQLWGRPGVHVEGLLSEFGRAFQRLGYQGSVKISVVLDSDSSRPVTIEIDMNGSLFREDLREASILHVVDASRRLQREDWTQETTQRKVSDMNLKRSLFYAHNSSLDFGQKRCMIAKPV